MGERINTRPLDEIDQDGVSSERPYCTPYIELERESWEEATQKVCNEGEEGK